jgi:hypothetical protein
MWLKGRNVIAGRETGEGVRGRVVLVWSEDLIGWYSNASKRKVGWRRSEWKICVCWRGWEEGSQMFNAGVDGDDHDTSGVRGLGTLEMGGVFRPPDAIASKTS